MKTQCKTAGSKEQGQIALDLGLGRLIEGNFDGGQISSDGGLLLLRKADEELQLTEMAAFCFGDTRRPDLVKHTVSSLIMQRVYAIAAGYEDCNDAARLRRDPMHMLAAGKGLKELASQPTLSRWENSADDVTLKLLQNSLVLAYIRHLKRRKRKPKVIRLAVDTTEDKAHGAQQLTFFNGFYGSNCYTPLFVFTEDGFPLAALLRAGNASPSDGAVRMLRGVVKALKAEWPAVRIELTADAGFATPELYDFCELNAIGYLICIKGNDALDNQSEPVVQQAKDIYDELCGPTPELGVYGKLTKSEKERIVRRERERMRYSSKAEGRMQELFENEEKSYIRKFHDFQYQARSWPHARRIIARVDYTRKGPDVRYVVTNYQRGRAHELYDKYCQRSQCENWIKDLKTYLKCDRTSCQEFKANQLRLLIHAYSYILLWLVGRKAGLRHTTVVTIQLHLIKIGVLVKETARRISLKLASNHPWKDEFLRSWNTA